MINRKIIHEGGVSKVQFDIDESESQKWFNGVPDLKFTKIDSNLPPAPKDILIEDKQLKKWSLDKKWNKRNKLKRV